MTSPLLQTIQLQQLASDPKNSAWVFASAGSGKTKILTDRVLRLLLSGISPNKILCLTFTKVAAAEMQSRINSELAKWILCDDAELEKKLNELSGQAPKQNDLKKARTLLIKILDEESKIKVQTIHAFCQTLIKIFPFEAKVRPNFEVLESVGEQLFLKQAQKEILKKATSDESLKKLVQEINSKLHEEGLSDLVSGLIGKKEKLEALKEEFFGIEGVIAEIFKNLSLSKNSTAEEIYEEFKNKIDFESVNQLVLALEATGLANNKKFAAAINSFIKAPKIENFSGYEKTFFTKEKTPRKMNRIDDGSSLYFIAETQRNLIEEFLEKLNSLKIAQDTAQLLRFSDLILENYSQQKKQNAFLDYDDLIAETVRLLANPDFSNWVKMKMDSSFDHILIDESQDTNHQQWNIIKALSEDFFSGLSASNFERSIFIVGDEKQSIYSFQGAEPNISSEIFSYFENKLAKKLKKIELNNSFRSSKNILSAVDAVFSDEARKNAISKLAEFKEHKAIRDGNGIVEIWPQVKVSKEKSEEEDEDYEDEKPENYDWKIDFLTKKEAKNQEILAEIIARKIKDWVDNSRLLENRERPVKYGDFMILLRNHTNGFSATLSKVFHKFKIPFSTLSRVKFSESLLVQDLLAAAKFALLPQDDLNLACLLKSPLFEISEEELLEICLEKNHLETFIYKVLENSNKFRKTYDNLNELIRNSQEKNSFEFFYSLINEKNNHQKIISHFGVEALEILDQFTLITFDFYQKFSPNLQKFLSLIEKLDPEISSSFSENNQVRVTTIHSAKGLQAPVVMLPDCSYNFNKLPSSKENISWIEFFGTKFPLWCTKKSDLNELLKAHRKEKSLEAEEEYLRLLYVAMTRSEDELYIGGFGDSHDSHSWYEIIKHSLIGKANFVSESEFFKEIAVKEEKETEDLAVKIINHKTTKSLVKAASSQINKSQIKGRLIHKILEIFGKNFKEDKKWLAELVKKVVEMELFLKESEKKLILDQAFKFMDSQHFDNLFSGEVKCEVEIVGDENLVRIDLLIEKENEIIIIDYKSDEILPQLVPTAYIAQLENYEKLVQKIYPTKKISCAILWVKFLELKML